MEKRDEEYYKELQRLFEEIPDNFSILEEQVDMDIQLKYFEHSRKLRKKSKDHHFEELSEELMSADTIDDRKREILIQLAGSDDVKAYRFLEKYVDKALPEIREWAVLALQESRMVIQTSLLDEQQYFISTGLGGRDKKLRYYLVLINRDQELILSITQQKLIRNELIFGLEKMNGEFESIDFSEGFSTALVLIPITVNIQELLRQVVEECNQYGDFLNEEMIITNVKILSRSEILDIIKTHGGSDS